MIWIRRIILLFFTTLFVLTANGQKTFQPKSVEFDWKGIVYRKEKSFEARVYTNGWLLGVNFGNIDTYYKTRYYHLSLGCLSDPREKSQNRNIAFSFPMRSKSFVFGKQNSIINLRGGIGVTRYISEKAKRKGIALGYDYLFGPSLALVKPYYLNLIYAPEGSQERVLREEKYGDDNADKFTTYNDIFGGVGFFKGFDEIKVVPGIHGKIGLLFSLGAFDEYVKAMEVGVMGDLYLKKLPIMIETETVSNKPYFFNFYLKLLLGKRSN